MWAGQGRAHVWAMQGWAHGWAGQGRVQAWAVQYIKERWHETHKMMGRTGRGRAGRERQEWARYWGRGMAKHLCEKGRARGLRMGAEREDYYNYIICNDNSTKFHI